MIISVDASLRDPPYQQIRVQVLAAAASGELAAGTKLPTIRQLADDLDLAPGTVARAYRELEADGVIETRGRKGSFVRQPSPQADPGAGRLDQLDSLARSFIDEALRLGAPASEITGATARAIAANAPTPKPRAL